MSALATMAAYIYEFQNDQGGGHLRTALLAQILADRYGLEPAHAIRVARSTEHHDDIKQAGRERDELIDQARRAAVAAEMGEEVPA